MAEERLNRLNLFEAVVFAIYGNWLIALLTDKVSFTRFPVSFNVFGIWFQEVCVGLAFACLIILFFYSIFRPQTVNRKLLFILYMGHVIGIYSALSVEELTKSDIIFYLIGFFMFWITFFIEIRRIRIVRANRNG